MLTLDLIREAHQRIAPHVHRTPVLHAATLDAIVGTEVFFKAENFQKVGAFKARGATNAVLALPAEVAARGVVTHSSGNHAAAVARAAALRGVPASIVMPTTVPRAKQEAVRAYGGRISFCAATLAAREAGARELLAETGGTMIHPYNDLRVMAGQGTAAVEFIEDAGSFDWILAPVGGGGLISGTAVAAKALCPQARVVGVEPAGADDAFRSFTSGQLAPAPDARTIADGLRGALGPLTFAEIRRHVDEIVTVPEAAIIRSMRLMWERLKIVVEPSAAVPFAALLEQAVRIPPGARVGILVTGGNVDLEALPWVPS